MTSFYLIAMLLARPDTADITFKPVAGAMHSFETHQVSTIDAGGQSLNVDVTVDITNTTGDTDGGVTNMTGVASNLVVLVDGKSQAAPSSNAPLTYKVNNVGFPLFDAETIKKMQVNIRARMTTTLTRPDQPIEINKPFKMDYKGDPDLGTVDAKAQTTVLGSEVVDGIDCWKLQSVYAEQVSDSPMSSVAEVYLSKEDHELVKASADLENYTANAMMPPSHSHVDTKRIANPTTARK